MFPFQYQRPLAFHFFYMGVPYSLVRKGSFNIKGPHVKQFFSFVPQVAACLIINDQETACRRVIDEYRIIRLIQQVSEKQQSLICFFAFGDVAYNAENGLFAVVIYKPGIYLNRHYRPVFFHVL